MMIRQIALLGYIKSMIHAGDSNSAQCMRLKNKGKRKDSKKRKQAEMKYYKRFETVDVAGQNDMQAM